MNIKQEIEYWVKEKQKSEKNINFLKNYNKNYIELLPVDFWEQYAKIYKSYKEKTNVFEKIILDNFPMAENIVIGWNDVSFALYNLRIIFPLTDIGVVKICENYYISSMPKYKKDKSEIWLEKYIELLERKASWKELCDSRINIENKLFRYLYWFVVVVPKDIKYKQDINYFKNQLKEINEKKLEYYQSDLKKYKKYLIKWDCFLKNGLPLLKNFCKNKWKIVFDNYFDEDFLDKIKNQIKNDLPKL